MAKKPATPVQAEITPELWDQVRDLCNTLSITVCALQSVMKSKLKLTDAEWQSAFTSAQEGLDKLHSRAKKKATKRAPKK